MGAKSVELLLEGKSNRIVCMQKSEVVDVDIEDGLKMKKTISDELLRLTRQLAI